jgi:hypothetical protein
MLTTAWVAADEESASPIPVRPSASSISTSKVWFEASRSSESSAVTSLVARTSVMGTSGLSRSASKPPSINYQRVTLTRVFRTSRRRVHVHSVHRALNQAAPLRPLPDGVTDLGQLWVQRRDRAGGVIHEYRLVA